MGAHVTHHGNQDCDFLRWPSDRPEEQTPPKPEAAGPQPHCLREPGQPCGRQRLTPTHHCPERRTPTHSEGVTTADGTGHWTRGTSGDGAGLTEGTEAETHTHTYTQAHTHRAGLIQGKEAEARARAHRHTLTPVKLKQGSRLACLSGSLNRNPHTGGLSLYLSQGREIQDEGADGPGVQKATTSPGRKRRSPSGAPPSDPTTPQGPPTDPTRWGWAW